MTYNQEYYQTHLEQFRKYAQSPKRTAQKKAYNKKYYQSHKDYYKAYAKAYREM